MHNFTARHIKLSIFASFTARFVTHWLISGQGIGSGAGFLLEVFRKKPTPECMSASAARLNRSASHPEQLARSIARRPGLLQEALAGLEAPTARTRFGCAKALRLLSEQHPALLYPHFEFFAGLLEHPNKILQWEAARIVAALATVDAENKFNSIFRRYFAPVRGPVMITAATLIRSGAGLARARPELAARIAAEIMKVEQARFATRECRNVALGHAIVALGEFAGQLRDPGPARRFVRRQLKNARPATRKKAAEFLKRQEGKPAPPRPKGLAQTARTRPAGFGRRG